ncbi:uncharacterized protein TNCV_3776711 [Trichonephila clavipes]|nr:uncharacterized protein TNCV_3776711 [Trichonephila clavipes]
MACHMGSTLDLDWCNPETVGVGEIWKPEDKQKEEVPISAGILSGLNHNQARRNVGCIKEKTPLQGVESSRRNRCAIRKFRTLKGLRKGPLSAKNLRLMVTKFEKTGSLNVRSGRGKKPVSAEAIEKIALQVEEDNSSNVLASTSVRRVAEALDLPRSTVQKIMRNILRYYPYKLQFVQELLPHDFETRHLFSLQFLARLEVDPEWPWNILWTDEAHFHLDG